VGKIVHAGKDTKVEEIRDARVATARPDSGELKNAFVKSVFPQFHYLCALNKEEPFFLAKRYSTWGNLNGL
jgi:hypothetical protein